MLDEWGDSTDENARKALLWGIFTWVGNLLGCAIGMVPIALPIGIVATIVTLFVGMGAMYYGGKARFHAPDPSARRDAMLGFWLGAVHIGFVAMLAGIGFVIFYDVGNVRALFGL